jgi:hypothetical protein
MSRRGVPIFRDPISPPEQPYATPVQCAHCITCQNPFTFNNPNYHRVLTLVSLQQSFNATCCGECQLLSTGVDLIFGQETRKYANPGVTLKISTWSDIGTDVRVSWYGAKKEEHPLKFWRPPGMFFI